MEEKTGKINNRLEAAMDEAKRIATEKAELRRLRRLTTMKARRTEPIKDVGIRINVDAEEYRRLSDNAAKAAMTLSNYIRYLLKNHG